MSAGWLPWKALANPARMLDHVTRCHPVVPALPSSAPAAEIQPPSQGELSSPSPSMRPGAVKYAEQKKRTLEMMNYFDQCDQATELEPFFRTRQAANVQYTLTTEEIKGTDLLQPVQTRWGYMIDTQSIIRIICNQLYGIERLWRMLHCL